jgi:DNA-binding beta-propeller fold protein YncE
LRFVSVVCAVLSAHTAGARLRLLRLVAPVGVVALLVTLVPGAAFGARRHVFSFAFPSVASKEVALALASSPKENAAAPGSGLAVNNATHNVYVADTGDRRVDEFEVDGPAKTAKFVRAWGWGVATGAAKLEVCASGCLSGLSGSEPGEFETPTYVAVDNSAGPSKGDVYVADVTDNLVTKFDAEGNLIAAWGNNGENAKKERTEPNGQLNGSPTEVFNKGFFLEPVDGIGIDGTGKLWVWDGTERLFEFGQEGTSIITCTAHVGSAQDGGIAAAEAGTDVLGYTRVVFQVGRECPSGTATTDGQITAGTAEVKGLALDTSNGDLYVDREGVRIEDISASCKPSPHGCQPTQIFGESPLEAPLTEAPPPPLEDATGVAVDAKSGFVYVANTATQQIAAFRVGIEATVEAPSGVGATEAVLHGTVNPSESQVSHCIFEYGPTASYGHTQLCEQSPEAIGKGSSPVAVSARIEGLAGGTEYHYRLRVVNGNGAVASEDEHFATHPTVKIEEVTTSKLEASLVNLVARVNPEGLSAHYHFEYGPCVPEGCSSSSSKYEFVVPVPDAPIAAGGSPVTVSQHIEGLSVGTAYHFRLAVEDANKVATQSREVTFIAEPAPPTCPVSRPRQDGSLPDCRAYEQVTPPDKNGALVNVGGLLTLPSIASDGSRVLAKSIQCFHGPPSCVGIRQTEGDPFEFQRGEDGWETMSLAPPIATPGTMVSYNAETGMVLYALGGDPSAPEELVARAADGTLHSIGPIGENPNPVEAPGSQAGALVDVRSVMTPDLSHIAYQLSYPGWPSLESGSKAETIFKYSGMGNSRPTLVPVTGPAGSTSQIGACGVSLGGRGGISSLHDTLSSDGATTVFTVDPCKGGTGENTGTPVPVLELWERSEPGGEPSTVEISGAGPENECNSVCQGEPLANAAYQGASPDDSKVYFTSTAQLTNEASEDKRTGESAWTPGCPGTASGASGCNLYEFECPHPCKSHSESHLVDVSAGDTSGLGPQVQGVIAVSSDGSGVYFVARGVLTGANAAGVEPVAGGLNLYGYRDGSGGGSGHLQFVATLAASDSELWEANEGIGIANVTPDGRFLVFTSHRGLTPDATREEGPAQVYRYDAAGEALTRVSVGRQGYDNNGNSSTVDAHFVRLEELVSGNGSARTDPTMSDDGQFVFFESPSALAPGALDEQPVIGNEKLLAENVYEWAADGARTRGGETVCGEPGGCVSLISDGKDIIERVPGHRLLLGSDASGENVFFWSADSLVPSDVDTQIDLYDARVHGGFPETGPSGPCEALETCRPAPSAPPGFETTFSNVFSGGGNILAGTPLGGGSQPRRITPAQQFANALAKCRRLGGAHARRSCERNARRVYSAQLLAGALKACKKKHGRARVSCEHRARARLKARGASLQRSNGGGR